jgi:hypothetical protein
MPTDPRPTLANDSDTSLAHRIARRRPAAHGSECVECRERLGDGLLRSWTNPREQLALPRCCSSLSGAPALHGLTRVLHEEDGSICRNVSVTSTQDLEL